MENKCKAGIKQDICARKNQYGKGTEYWWVDREKYECLFFGVASLSEWKQTVWLGLVSHNIVIILWANHDRILHINWGKIVTRGVRVFSPVCGCLKAGELLNTADFSPLTQVLWVRGSFPGSRSSRSYFRKTKKVTCRVISSAQTACVSAVSAYC